MNAKQKEILQVQRSLLSRNIVWSPALAASLRSQNLLTESMIAQIEGAQGAENKILVMLDLLPLRTSQVYEKFADALHLSGHTLIADFLREEDISKQPLNMKDLFKRLPFLSKNVKDNEKKQIEAYMAEKIQSAILAHTWSWNTKEKDKALVAKQEQLEQAHVHEQQLKKKQAQLLEAQKQTKEAREEIQAVKAELRAVTDNAGRFQQQMRGQMDTQMKFSMANDSIAHRTSQRLERAEGTLRDIQEQLATVVELSTRGGERERMLLAENPFCFLAQDVAAFLAQFRQLLVVQLRHQDLLEERSYILHHLGVAPEKIMDEQEPSTLQKAYEEFVAQNDAHIDSLKKEVDRYAGLLEDLSRSRREEEKKLAAAGTVWQSAIMSVMRKQLQDLKSALHKKDSTLGIKDAEISKLRSRVTELEAALSSKIREADVTSRALTLSDLHNGHVTGSPSLDSLEPPPRTSASPPHPTLTPNNHITPGLPPLKSGGSHKTSTSPRPGGGRGAGAVGRVSKKPTTSSSVPRGVVVTDAPLTRYPTGLTTMQLRVETPAHAHPRALAPSTADPRAGKPPMGSTLGDLRAMHSRYTPGAGIVATRGGAAGGFPPGAGGTSLDITSSPGGVNAKSLVQSSPAARRKMAAKVK